MNILITAPHACSIENAAHVCDVGAHGVAQMLGVLLEAGDIHVSTILNPTTPRDRLDVNRVEGRNHPYRKAIYALLPTVDLLIDVHSFPRGEPRFEGNDVVVFNMPTTFDDEFVRRLYLGLLNQRVRALLYDGSPENDTVASALEMGKMAVLLEFREDAIYRVKEVAHAILDAARATL